MTRRSFLKGPLASAAVPLTPDPWCPLPWSLEGTVTGRWSHRPELQFIGSPGRGESRAVKEAILMHMDYKDIERRVVAYMTEQSDAMREVRKEQWPGAYVLPTEGLPEPPLLWAERPDAGAHVPCVVLADVPQRVDAKG